MQKQMFYMLCFLPLALFSLSYEVHFVGLTNKETREAVEESSSLLSKQQEPFVSINALRYRIDTDTEEFLKILKAFSYYDATISSKIERKGEEPIQVFLFFHTGPQYTLKSYDVFEAPRCKCKLQMCKCSTFPIKPFLTKENKPVTSVDLVNEEAHLLYELSRCGYPLAQVEKRRVIVDQKTKEIESAACIEKGPLTKFGPTTVFGIKKINPRFIERKISWKEGENYNSDLVVKTQEKLLKTELFTSVLISHANTVNPQDDSLAMKMRVTEAKFQKVTFGVFYATVDGFGGSFQWRHRNFRSMGEILSTKGEASQKLFLGNVTYIKPDFLRESQSWRTLLEIAQEKIRAYLSLTYRGASFLERIWHKARFSVGLKYENIDIAKSAVNGSYSLIGLPIFARYDTSDSFLDPTKGFTVFYSITPYQSLRFAKVHFMKQRFTATTYLPLHERAIVAVRAQFGSIAGAQQSDIPLSKLFLGGSEDDLRGYRYKTVSPLGPNQAILGARSAIYSSLEVRLRIVEKVGIVPFFDIGALSKSVYPRFDQKWLKSVGVGGRYYTFFGPLRFDIGFPLNKRRGIDKAFEFYGSVGQAF